MKAVIFYNHQNNVNGAVIDCIEYYLCILEENKDVKFLIFNYNKEFKQILNDLIEDRYELKNIDYKTNISEITISKLLRIKFDRLLILDYSTIANVKGFIAIKNNNSKIIILSDLHTDKPEFTINKSLYPEGCVVYYGEMPFVYKDVQYKHKFLFSKFKKLTKVNNAVFVHSPKNNDYSFLKLYKNILETKNILYKTNIHKKHLFELFDTFLYYHADTWFDPRPRLMHECKFYNKIIYYYNIPECIDGSFYRFNDLKTNGIVDRHLTKDDEIVRQFI